MIIAIIIAALVVGAIGLFFALTSTKRALPSSERDGAQSPDAAGAEGVAERGSAKRISARPSATQASAAIAPAAALDTSARAAPRVVSADEVRGLRKGLSASRGGFVARLASLFSGKHELDASLVEQLEEVMLTSDIGVQTTRLLLERVREGLERKSLADRAAVWAALRAQANAILDLGAGKLEVTQRPMVVLMVGVNGVGKTTTIGKLATQFAHQNKRVMLAAGDTFRAAAVAQLEVWGKRVGAEVIRGKEGADPGAVAFEAVQKAIEGGVDVLLIDTAGRLHTKAPLMDEIKKVRRSIGKALDGAPHETLLVLDATTGQNALTQAQMFKEAVDFTGIVLTKLDGTAKGGIVVSICDELRVPIRYIGLGERAEDLREFYAPAFVEALFGDGDESQAA
jgi:fused signal recognition particle receptor